MTKYLKDLVGKDKLVGRPIRVNRKTLEVGKKGYAELMFLGDIHLGAQACDIDRVESQIQYALDNHVYVLGMGDFMEAGTRGSVGTSVYDQKFNPDTQMAKIEEMFRPLSEKGLILGLHSGNHCDRIQKDTSVNVMAELPEPEAGSAVSQIFSVSISQAS